MPELAARPRAAKPPEGKDFTLTELPSSPPSRAALPRTRSASLARWVTALALCAAAWAAHVQGLLQPLQARITDAEWRWMREHQPQPVANDVVLVAFDDAFISQASEPFALYHAHLARLLEALAAGGPALVALDIALPEKSYFGFVPRAQPGYDYDQVLLRAIGLAARQFPVLLAKTLDDSGHRLRDIHVDFLAAADRSRHLAPGQGAAASAVLCPDEDQVVRRYPGPWCAGEGKAAPLAAAMAQVHGNRQDWSGSINYRIGPPMPVLTVREVFAALDRQDTEWLRRHFGRATVLVGLVTREDDRHRAPVALAQDEALNLNLPGVMLHAQAYRSLMNDGLVQPLSPAGLALCAALGLVCWLGRRLSVRILLCALCCGGVVAAGGWLLLRNREVPLMLPLASALIGLAGSLAFDAWATWRERQHLRRTFAGYASPMLMQQIQAGAVSPDSRGIKARTCILFSDIRGFTRLSETLPAEAVVELLNAYLGEMTRIVHRHGGIIDKFIGDSVMALFGQPAPLARPERAALEAAHEMLLCVERLNQGAFRARGIALQIGIGVHSGDAVLGYVGSHERHDFTAIGDSVNTAARLESLCKTLGVPIVCSQAVAEAVGTPAFLRDRGEHAVQGRAPVHVFSWDPLAVRAQPEEPWHAVAV